MKECFKCGATKPYTEFYKHKGMKDGYLGKCKTCTKSDVKTNRDANSEYYREYDKERHHNNPERRAANHASSKKWRKENPVRHAELTKAWLLRNPDKRKAHYKVSNALRSGKIEKKPCAVCGAETVQAHHPDYSKPLEVQWLCITHHHETHVKERRRR